MVSLPPPTRHILLQAGYNIVEQDASMPPNIISCNYKDVLTGRVHVFDLTNLC
jgi:hypothetical protein